jgi:hypothetical protein
MGNLGMSNLMGDYRLDAQGVCDSMVSNVAFGIFCQFTSTNKNKYFFDNSILEILW